MRITDRANPGLANGLAVPTWLDLMANGSPTASPRHHPRVPHSDPDNEFIVQPVLSTTASARRFLSND